MTMVVAADAATLLADATETLHDHGHLARARRLFERAYAAAAGDPDVEAEAALGLAGLWAQEHRSATVAAAVRERLERAVSPRHDLRIRIRLAGEQDYRAGTHEGILRLLDEARAAGDPVAVADAASLAHHCVLGPEHGTLRRDLAAELAGAGARTGRRSDQLMALLWQTVDLFLDGDPHAARRLAELRGLLEERDHAAVGYVADAIDVMLGIRQGRFDDGALAACRDRGSEAGDADADGWFGAQLVATRWYQGRVAELLPMLREFANSPTLSAVDNSYFAVLAVAAAGAGDHREAAGALARLRLAELPRSSSWLVTMYGVVEAAHLLGDADLSAEAYALLLPHACLPMMASLGVACFGSVRHSLGVAALTTGDVEGAVEHLAGAVRDNLAMGHWPATMFSRVRYAQALALRGAPGDAVAARRERDTAGQEAQRLAVPVPVYRSRSLAPDAGALQCRRQGRTWRVELGRRAVVVEHSVGLAHLALLSANPGQEIEAIELAAGAAFSGVPASAQPVLDDVARAGYRRRLVRLHQEIEVYEARHEGDRAADARAERDWLVDELAAATGIHGRDRRFPDAEERARVAVGKAIRRAVSRVEAADEVLGAHLRAAVHTGLRCSYRP